jgi:uncharacterized protein YqhQ
MLGGQALNEGVCVRTSERWAVAVRRPDATIHTEAHALTERWPRLRKSFLRGPVALADAVSVGLRASDIAIRESTGVTSEGGAGVVLAPVAVAILAIFVGLPAIAARSWTDIAGDVAEASVRAAMLLVYLGALSRSAFARRLFAYHGAEHKAIAACERAGRMPTADEAGAESPVHVRCGTDFISLFVITCGVVFSFVGRDPWLFAIAVRVALVPVVMVLAYELMRLAARFEGSLGSRLVTWPGRALQRITTREPSDDQLEVALAALRTAIAVTDEP